MNSKTYVSDPNLWHAFYKNMAEKRFNPYKYRPKQKGRGWGYKTSYRIPVRPNSEIDIQPKVPLVTPVAAVEERTKDELKKNIREGNPHIDPQNGIKRKVRQHVHIPSKKLKGPTTTAGYKERSKKKPVTNRQSKKLPNLLNLLTGLKVLIKGRRIRNTKL